MAVDFRWMSRGGVLLDSTGDVSFTQTPWECLRSMVNSRLKAAFDGWKSYQIGADLENIDGDWGAGRGPIMWYACRKIALDMSASAR